MKLNLPTADSIRKNQKKADVEKKDNARKIALKFLEGKMKAAILASSNNFAMVEIPVEAYSCANEFYKICAEELAPLGYTAEESHDGGGMYSTLAVSWGK